MAGSTGLIPIRPGVRSTTLSTGQPGPSRGRVRRVRKGQALVVAVTIMFILLAVGLLFLRNALVHLQSTGVSNERVADLNYARSGIDFVDHQLMTSPLGADWRPQPRNLNPAPAADGVLAALDPDFQYLRPWAPADTAVQLVGTYKGQPVMRSLAGPSGGFTRIGFGQGRALVRVTYNPRNAISFQGQPINLPLATDLPSGAKLFKRGPWMEYGPTPLSLYVRIDTIGRFGATASIDNNGYADPTLIVNAGIDRPYRVQMVAYKAFGLGDHLLFVTNKDKEGGSFDVGYDRPEAFPPAGLLPGISLASVNFLESPGQMPGDVGAEDLAGSLLVNGPARWNDVRVGVNANPLLLGTGVDMAGPLVDYLPGNPPPSGLFVNGVQASTTSAMPTGSLLAGDLVRDSNWFNNQGASPLRSIRRLESPPLNLDHYRTLTRDSNGAGLYITNSEDLQPSLSAVQQFLGQNHDPEQLGLAPQVWFNPYNPPKLEPDSTLKTWDVQNPIPVYYPPAVEMVFQHPLPQAANDPDPFTAKYYFIRLQKLTASGVVSFLDAYYTPDAIADANLQAAVVNNTKYGPQQLGVALITNHTIMAEGNLSIHGDVAPGMASQWWPNNNNQPGAEGAQLVVVSRGTIYLDGSLNRAEDGNATPQGIGNYNLGTLLVPSAVALLAQDHVAINLTQIRTRVQKWDPSQSEANQPDADIPATEPDIPANPANQGEPPSANHWTFDPIATAGGGLFRVTFSLVGVAPNTPVRLYLRHAVKVPDPPNTGGNPNNCEVDAALIDPNGNAVPIVKAGNGLTPYIQNSVTPTIQSIDGTGPWECGSYLLPAGSLNYGGNNVIHFQVTANTYYLSRVEVKPESHPEQGLYKPETTVTLDGAFLANAGSLYVIPKEWFYFNPPAGYPLRRKSDGPMNPSGAATQIPNPVDWSNSNGSLNWNIDQTYPGYYPMNGDYSPPAKRPADTLPIPPGGPLLQQVILNGSLTVNRLAPLEYQSAWNLYNPLPQYSLQQPGPNGGTLDPFGAPVYQFDDEFVDLAFRPNGSANQGDSNNWLPIMPRIPMVPGLVYEGEGAPL